MNLGLSSEKCVEKWVEGGRTGVPSVLAGLALSNGPGGGADIEIDVCANLARCAAVKSYVGHHSRFAAPWSGNGWLLG